MMDSTVAAAFIADVLPRVLFLTSSSIVPNLSIFMQSPAKSLHGMGVMVSHEKDIVCQFCFLDKPCSVKKCSGIFRPHTEWISMTVLFLFSGVISGVSPGLSRADFRKGFYASLPCLLTPPDRAHVLRETRISSKTWRCVLGSLNWHMGAIRAD